MESPPPVLLDVGLLNQTLHELTNCEASPQAQENSAKLLFDITVGENVERMLFTFPSLMQTLVDLACAGCTVKTKQYALKSIFNLTFEDVNLQEMFHFPRLVDVLVAALEQEENVKSKQTALDTLANLANVSVNQRGLFQHAGLPQALISMAQRGESAATALQRGALDALGNLALDSANQIDLVKQFALLPVLVQNLGGAVDCTVQVATLDCLTALALAESNKLTIVREPGLIAALCKMVSSTTQEVKTAALSALLALAKSRSEACKLELHESIPVLLDNGSQTAIRILYHLTLVESVEMRAKIFANGELLMMLLNLSACASGQAAEKWTTVLCEMTLANICGATEDEFSSQALQDIITVLQFAVCSKPQQQNWQLIEVLFPLRFLFVVKRNRSLALSKQSELPSMLLNAVKLAVEVKDALACELALAALLLLTLDPSAVAVATWMDKHRKLVLAVIAQVDLRFDAHQQATRRFSQAIKYQFQLPQAAKHTTLPSPHTAVGICWHESDSVALLVVEQNLARSNIAVTWKSNSNNNCEELHKVTTMIVLVSKQLHESPLCALVLHNSCCRIIPIFISKGFDFQSSWLGALPHITNLHPALTERTIEESTALAVQFMLRDTLIQSSSTATAAATCPSLLGLPNTQREIQVWLESTLQGGAEISSLLLANGICSAKDLQLLLREPASEIKNLVQLNASQAMRLKDAWNNL